jgi:predicted lactoylglutathione lyase
MISYLMVGTGDLPRAVKYFDALMDDMGAAKAATVGNGSMVSFSADSREKVDVLYAKALELGGTSEGAPGLRGETLYAAYFRDPDGNKFNFICYL